jgi:hypothetical protein
MVKLSKYSFGIGDRFGNQGEAQLKAIIDAGKNGVEITPVWNKSNREHLLTGTHPEDVRNEADLVTEDAGFTKPYFVDADHINSDTVDRFIGSSDFFTIDVASYIGTKAGNDEISDFISGAEKYCGEVRIPGMEKSLRIDMGIVRGIAEKYLFAIQKAGEIYRIIEKSKGKENFVTEVSMDEVLQPQSATDLFLILKMIAGLNIPVQTIAPKFSGKFCKGIDYIGNPIMFSDEFERDIMIIEFSAREFGLPENLKISIHSGSDKFSIYPVIGSVIRKRHKGIHIKTAGTTWLEEMIGLTESGGRSLDFVKELYFKSLDQADELCAPYSDVIDIKISRLPSKAEVAGWNGKKFADALRHDESNKDYNPDLQQMIHVAYKLAAQNREEFFDLTAKHREAISECVYGNIYRRHICRIFDIK